MQNKSLNPKCTMTVAFLSAFIILLSVFNNITVGGSIVESPKGPSFTGEALARWTDGTYYRAGRLDVTKVRIDGAVAPLGEENAVTLSPGSVLTIAVEVEKTGDYSVALDYLPIDARMTDAELVVGVDSVSYDATIPLLWKDASPDYSFDKYGNEMLPEQENITDFVINPLMDAQSMVGKQELVFQLASGNHTLSIQSLEQGLKVRSLFLAEKRETDLYDTYIDSIPDGLSPVASIIPIEAEKYAVKTDSFIRGTSVKNPALSPYDTYKRRINVIDENSWNSPGQKIAWEFDVEQEGKYHIGFRYAQAAYPGKPSYRRIEIDGKLLFREMEAVAFPQTKGGKHSNLVLSGAQNQPYAFYLEPGRHVISMTVTLGDAQEPYRQILGIMQRINDISAEIRKVTGGIADKNRTWDMQVSFPNVISQLKQCISDIENAYAHLKSGVKDTPSYANDLVYAADILRNLLKKPQTLPNKIKQLSEGDQSANKYLGNMLMTLVKQPLSLDRIYIYGEEQELPPAQASLFHSISNGVKSFFYSFLPEASQADYSDFDADDSKELKVWVNRPIQYVQILQQIIDADYNRKNHTNIRLSVMRDEQKLILSNAAGNNPDVGLGVNYYTPFDFAIRGAAKNLLDFDDFLPFYNENYNLESLVPMCYQDGVYGAAETLDFQVLFYRKDIFESLELSVPDTWDDVKKIMPVLLQNSMNFSTPIATQGGFKTYNTTSPFIFQNGGTYLSDDGAEAALRSDATFKGLTAMTDLYNVYGIQASVANFYNSFRFGQTPVGIGGFSMYLQMKLAAPELTGKWEIALTPGQKQADGSVARYQMSNSTACMIFEKSNKSDQAWHFLKWWLSKETQIKFSNLLESTLGPEYRWNTANLGAFVQLPYPKKDRDIILKQLSSQKEVVRHPANYMLEREVSNVWNNAVANGKPLIEAVDKAQLNADREILRKLKEFGFLDEDGNLRMDYNTDPVGRLRKMLEEGAN